MRKLLPAMYARDRAKDLPPDARIICVGRHEWSQQQFLNAMEENARPHIAASVFDVALWKSFCARITYVTLNARDGATYQSLVNVMRTDPAITHVFYLATPPSLFSTICHNLAE